MEEDIDCLKHLIKNTKNTTLLNGNIYTYEIRANQIKALENILIDYKQKTKTLDIQEKLIQTFGDELENLYEKYKQNEKVIEEMAIAMEYNHCGIKDIVEEEICDNKRCIGTAMRCRDCIIEYFRKKCE